MSLKLILNCWHLINVIIGWKLQLKKLYVKSFRIWKTFKNVSVKIIPFFPKQFQIQKKLYQKYSWRYLTQVWLFTTNKMETLVWGVKTTTNISRKICFKKISFHVQRVFLFLFSKDYKIRNGLESTLVFLSNQPNLRETLQVKPVGEKLVGTKLNPEYNFCTSSNQQSQCGKCFFLIALPFSKTTIMTIL